MTGYEYKVVPAPAQGRKAKGVRGAEARFAFALETVMNEMAAAGWDYVRAETLPSEERQGLSGKTTVFRNLLVFRRARDAAFEDFEPRRLDPPKEIPVLDAARAVQAEDGADTGGSQDGDAAAEAASQTDSDNPESPAGR